MLFISSLHSRFLFFIHEIFIAYRFKIPSFLNTLLKVHKEKLKKNLLMKKSILNENEHFFNGFLCTQWKKSQRRHHKKLTFHHNALYLCYPWPGFFAF